MDGNEEELRKTRQEDEFAALKSIYSGDIVDLRENDAWQVIYLYAVVTATWLCSKVDLFITPWLEIRNSDL